MNTTIIAYLTSLQNKVFKLLPMREAHDQGEDNHLYEYFDYILSNLEGVFIEYPELNDEPVVLEVKANIVYLYNGQDIPLKKWRSIVLHSVNLLSNLIANRQEV